MPFPFIASAIDISQAPGAPGENHIYLAVGENGVVAARARIAVMPGDSPETIAGNLRALADQLEAGEGPMIRHGYDLFTHPGNDQPG
jgi:hypothetical protein